MQDRRQPRVQCDFPPPPSDRVEANGKWYTKAWTPKAYAEYKRVALTKPLEDRTGWLSQ